MCGEHRPPPPFLPPLPRRDLLLPPHPASDQFPRRSLVKIRKSLPSIVKLQQERQPGWDDLGQLHLTSGFLRRSTRTSTPTPPPLPPLSSPQSRGHRHRPCVRVCVRACRTFTPVPPTTRHRRITSPTAFLHPGKQPSNSSWWASNSSFSAPRRFFIARAPTPERNVPCLQTEAFPCVMTRHAKNVQETWKCGTARVHRRGADAGKKGRLPSDRLQPLLLQH